MMAMFFAQRVILDKTRYGEISSRLHEGVKGILIDSGLGVLMDVE